LTRTAAARRGVEHAAARLEEDHTGKNTSPVKGTTYKIAKGDTLAVIARRPTAPAARRPSKRFSPSTRVWTRAICVWDKRSNSRRSNFASTVTLQARRAILGGVFF